MSWRDGLLLALRSVLRRPARTALTVLAVALGSGLLVALAAIAQVADTRVIGELGKGGPATAIKVAAAAPDPIAPDSDTPRAGAPRALDDAALRAIRGAPSVQSATPVLAQQVIVVPPPLGRSIPAFDGTDPDRGLVQPFNAVAVGVDLNAVGSLPVTLLAGRIPAAGSVTEVAVGLDYLDRLHLDVKRPEAVLGSEVELGTPQVQATGDIRVRARWTRVAITGVVAQQVGEGTFLASSQFVGAARSWQTSGVDGTAVGLPLPSTKYSGVIVVASSLDDIHTVRAEITTLGYSTSAPEHLVATVQRYLHVVDIVLGSIGLIALTIAALGIANALLAAVRERRREIGVLKAIGARDRDVLRWFLAEALFSGVAGGVLGTAAGLGAVAATGAVVNGYLVQQGLAGIDLGGIPLLTALIGVGGSALLALLAAAWPALRAARLPAREAVGVL
ncbi:MAG TPA: ABC transporter permease [Candidatus Dormibacteraeota bacterium]|jgi:ABC-type antimicrobial peptide transport system permease subunit|nr:ABC transporter permease [Candidatus Dormibacteraeota bacterium]